MYYIYHIEGVKIGCTNNIFKRVIKEQGYDSYKILFKTNCIKKASDKEIELQEEFGYKLDKTSYINLKTNNKMKTEVSYITKETVTFNCTKEHLSKPKLVGLRIELPLLGTISVSSRLAEWILENAIDSFQVKNTCYVYNKALHNAFSLLDFGEQCPNNIYDDIRDWAKEKGIYEKGDVKTQYIKFQEEAGELAKAIMNEDYFEFVDAIGDCVVVLTNLAELGNKFFDTEEGYYEDVAGDGGSKMYFPSTTISIENCILSAYKEIKDRKGKMVNGTFIKNK